MSSKKIAMAVFISDTESRLSTRRVGRKESIGIRVCEYKEGQGRNGTAGRNTQLNAFHGQQGIMYNIK